MRTLKLSSLDFGSRSIVLINSHFTNISDARPMIVS